MGKKGIQIMSFHSILVKALGGSNNPNLALIENELKTYAIGLIVPQIAKEVAHALIKSIDILVAATIKVTDEVTAKKVAEAHLTEIAREMDVVTKVLSVYVPLQTMVELEKKLHGNQSAEANAARTKRAPAILAVKHSVENLFNIIVGKSASP